MDNINNLLVILTIALIVFLIAGSQRIQLPHSLRAAAIMHFVAAIPLIFFPITTGSLLVSFLCWKLLGASSVFYAVLLHLRPNCNRKTKYEFLLIGIAAFQLDGMLVQAISAPPSTHSRLWIVLIFTLATFTVIQLITSYMVPPLSPQPVKLPSRGLIRIHRIVRAVSLPIAVISTIGFLPLLVVLVILCLNVRYVVGKRLESTPIIYLRSFHYADGPSVLGRIVTSVASRFGKVFAIVHAHQKGSDLLAHSRLTQQPFMFTAPDDQWRDFILSKLRTCSAVIIDRTISSDGLQWEVSKANELVDPSRIAILQKKGTWQDIIPGVLILDYELGKQFETKARKALKEWFDDIFGYRETCYKTTATREHNLRMHVYCTNCGVRLTGNAWFCHVCGVPTGIASVTEESPTVVPVVQDAELPK